MTNKQKYREFCKNELDIPVFSKDWWLDAVSVNGEWDVALVEKGDKIVASMPYYFTKENKNILISMPFLTQTMGPYIKYPENQKHYKKLSWEKELMSNLIDQLPSFIFFRQAFHHKITNWLPFYWKGFFSSIRYTYIINNLKSKRDDEILKDFTNAKRRDIKKASNIVQVKFDLSFEEFYKHHQTSLGKSGDKVAYSYEVFKNIYENSYKNNSGKSLYCIDEDGNIHSALFIVWDKNSTYALVTSLDPDFRSSGSLSLLFYEAIKLGREHSEVFDFEGSMIEYAEHSYRQFGGIQTPFMQIYKTNYPLSYKVKYILSRILGK